MWYKMSPFLLLIQIIDPVQHDTEIRVFIDRARLFYDLGGKTFLTNKHIGDDKTFYMHVLRFYIPHISRVTLVKHNLGVGIYSMQGYERRNKESKNVLKRFNNYKGNMVQNSLKHLWDVFYHEVTNVWMMLVDFNYIIYKIILHFRLMIECLLLWIYQLHNIYYHIIIF